MSNIKEFDVQWLGDVPESWTTLKLKFLCRINTGSKDTQDKLPDGKYPFFVRSPHVEGLNEYTHDEEAVMTAGDGVGVGKVFHHYEGKFAAHQRVYVFTEFKNVIGKYLYYYLMSNLKFEVLMGGAKSTVDSIRRPMLSEFPVVFPGILSQQQIVRFLDLKETQINNLIQAKEKYISLLEQQRQSIITEAVTKGLNPNVKMKDSGVEWIGEIPEHWEVKPLYSLYKENKLKNKGNKISNVLSLSYGKIKRRDVDSNYGLLPDSFETYQIMQKDDIVLRLTDLQNDKRSLRVGLVTEEGIITSAYLGLKQSDKSISAYTYYLLHSYDLMKVFYGLGSGVRQSMGYTEMKKLPILLPPIEEQNEIVELLKYKVRENEDLTNTLKIQIEKLKEYRQALIYEAVTGKIDVRDMELD